MIPGKQYTTDEILRIAWRRKWWALLPAVVVAAGVVVWVQRLPNLYKSDTLILVVPQRVPESYVRSTVTMRIEDRLQSITQQILSRTRLESVIQDFNLYSETRRTAIMEDIVERMRSDIDVQVVKGDAFRVGFTADDPRTAMRVAERLASLFIEQNLRDRELLAEGTNQFLEAQVEDARRRLIEDEKKLEEYRRLHAGELPTQLNANVQGQHNAELQLQALVDSLSSDRDRRLVVQRSIADADASDGQTPLPAAAVQTGDGTVPAGATAADRLQAAQEMLRAMEVRLTPQHPDFMRMKRVVADLQKKADEEALTGPVSGSARPLTPAELARKNRREQMNAELAFIDQQIANKQNEEKRLRGLIAAYQKRIEAAPARESELDELTRDYETLQTMYRSLLVKKEDSQVSANLERRQIGEQFKILDPARLPERPASPDRPRLYATGIVAGVAFGLALAALVEYLDKTLRSEADVEAAFNLLVLATVPVLRGSHELKLRRRKVLTLSVSVGLACVICAAALAWRLWK